MITHMLKISKAIIENNKKNPQIIESQTRVGIIGDNFFESQLINLIPTFVLYSNITLASTLSFFLFLIRKIATKIQKITKSVISK